MKRLTSRPKKAAVTQSVKCFRCHKPGHIRRNCLAKSPKEKSPVATAKDEESWSDPEEESEEIHLMDRGASRSDENKASTIEQEESNSESDDKFFVTESDGRIPPYIQRPFPDSMLFHSEPFFHSAHPHSGALPPEIMEHTCASQRMEIQNLIIENQNLAATYSASRHEFAAAQHELQRLQVLMMAGKSKHEHQIRPFLDKIAKMEADLKASESVKVELQQARLEAESLTVTKQVLISNVQQLTLDLQKSHADVQHVTSLVSELDALRQEYQSCRATYEYERKLRVDHYELLQVMQKNYVSMVGEVENLRRGLLNATKLDKAGGPYGSNVGYKEDDTSEQHALGQIAYEDNYNVHQGVGAARPTAPVAIYDASTFSHYNMLRTSSYDPLGGFPRHESFSVDGGALGAVSSANPTSVYGAGLPLQSLAFLQLPSAHGAFQVQTAYRL